MEQRTGYRSVAGLVWALALIGVSPTAFTADGLVAAGVTEDGSLLVSSSDSDLNVNAQQLLSTSAEATGDFLLAVGPGNIDSNQENTWISVFGMSIQIDAETTFPKGLTAQGAYVAISGEIEPDGTAIASNIVPLGGIYTPGISTVYLRGLVSSNSDGAIANVANTRVDMSQAYVDPTLLGLANDSLIEVLGVEIATTSNASIILASSASLLNGIHGSGARGIHGSGARGIHGSGARGIHGSGARGIHGSGARGIHGSGARGIHGSGARGIHGSGARGIHGSGARGIHGSGARGIHGSGARGIHGSGARGIHGSGAR